MADYIVIFGAAVRADGTASGSLRRRCEIAARHGRMLAHDGAEPVYLATGGVGRHGPAEPIVMRDLLRRLGVPDALILLESASHDTLQSVLNCSALMRRRGDAARVLVATSSYHRLRCRWLFTLAGFHSRALPAPSDRPHLGWAKWLRYSAKEWLVTPWDAIWVLLARARRPTIGG